MTAVLPFDAKEGLTKYLMAPSSEGAPDAAMALTRLHAALLAKIKCV